MGQEIINKIALLEAQISAFLEDVTEPLPPERVMENPNFRKWFGNSVTVNSDGTPMVFYHGSTSDIQEFFPSTSNYSESLNGFYFTDKPEVSDIYAKQADEILSSRLGSQDIPRSFANVLPVYLSIQNLFTRTTFRSNPTDTNANFSILLLNDTQAGKVYLSDTMPKELFSIYETELNNNLFTKFNNEEEQQIAFDKMRFQGVTLRGNVALDYLKKNGFDGVMIPSRSFGNFWIVFSPNQIKSIYNNGQFSTTSDNISEEYSHD